MDATDALIDSVSEETYGIVLMSNSMRVEHKRLPAQTLPRGHSPAALMLPYGGVRGHQGEGFLTEGKPLLPWRLGKPFE